MSWVIKTKVIVTHMFFYFCVTGTLVSCKNFPDIPVTQVERVGDREIEVVVRRQENAAYTLVFENGANNCVQRWEKVLKQIPEHVNVYAYNRPGYCKSSPATTARDSQNIVNELHDALHQQGLKPPYILIGHSMGGLYMQQFARQYPEEVHGLVLVDAMYPGFLKNSSEFPWYTKMGMNIFFSKAVREEIDFAHTSGAMIDRLPAIDDKPIVRLFNKPKDKTSGKAIEVDLGMFNKDDKSKIKIRNMYPHAKIIVVDSSHQMQETSPEVVMQAIADVMQARGALQ